MARASAVTAQLTWLNRLGRSESGETWRVRTADGELMVAKRVGRRSPAETRRLRKLMETLNAVPSEYVLPIRAVVPCGDVVWVVRAYDDGVSWARLARVTSPATSQALLLTQRLLEALAALHGTGVTHGSLRGENVFIGADGGVRFADAGMHRRDLGAKQAVQSDLAAAGNIVEVLWRPARRAAAPAIAALLSSDGLRQAGSAGAALERLRSASRDRANVDGDGNAGVRQLVERLQRPEEASFRPASQSAVVISDAQHEGRATEAHHALLRFVRDRRRRRVRRTLVVFAFTAALLTGVTVAVVHVVTSKPQPRGAVSGAANTPTSPRFSAPLLSSPTPIATPGAVSSPATYQPPAPSSAGFILDALLQPASGDCTLGSTCEISSRVDLAAHDATTVNWVVVAVDQCTGTQTVLATASVAALPDYGYLFSTDTVSLPAGDPLSLYAVTVSPVTVESAPLHVTGAAAC